MYEEDIFREDNQTKKLKSQISKDFMLLLIKNDCVEVSDFVRSKYVDKVKQESVREVVSLC